MAATFHAPKTFQDLEILLEGDLKVKVAGEHLRAVWNDHF
jgi:hypothetical protein